MEGSPNAIDQWKEHEKNFPPLSYCKNKCLSGGYEKVLEQKKRTGWQYTEGNINLKHKYLHDLLIVRRASGCEICVEPTKYRFNKELEELTKDSALKNLPLPHIKR